MTLEDAQFRKSEILKRCEANGLLDYQKLKEMRIINENNCTICPLCLKELSGNEFLNKVAQQKVVKFPT